MTFRAGAMSHAGSFDIKAPADFLGQMVLPQYNDFLTNNASSPIIESSSARQTSKTAIRQRQT